MSFNNFFPSLLIDSENYYKNSNIIRSRIAAIVDFVELLSKLSLAVIFNGNDEKNLLIYNYNIDSIKLLLKEIDEKKNIEFNPMNSNIYNLFKEKIFPIISSSYYLKLNALPLKTSINIDKSELLKLEEKVENLIYEFNKMEELSFWYCNESFVTKKISGNSELPTNNKYSKTEANQLLITDGLHSSNLSPIFTCEDEKIYFLRKIYGINTGIYESFEKDKYISKIIHIDSLYLNNSLPETYEPLLYEPTFSNRKMEKDEILKWILEEKNNKIAVLSGDRGIGKSNLVKSIYRYSQTISSKTKIIYNNFINNDPFFVKKLYIKLANVIGNSYRLNININLPVELITKELIKEFSKIETQKKQLKEEEIFNYVIVLDSLTDDHLSLLEPILKFNFPVISWLIISSSEKITNMIKTEYKAKHFFGRTMLPPDNSMIENYLSLNLFSKKYLLIKDRAKYDEIITILSSVTDINILKFFSYYFENDLFISNSSIPDNNSSIIKTIFSNSIKLKNGKISLIIIKIISYFKFPVSKDILRKIISPIINNKITNYELSNIIDDTLTIVAPILEFTAKENDEKLFIFNSKKNIKLIDELKIKDIDELSYKLLINEFLKNNDEPEKLNDYILNFKFPFFYINNKFDTLLKLLINPSIMEERIKKESIHNFIDSFIYSKFLNISFFPNLLTIYENLLINFEKLNQMNTFNFSNIFPFFTKEIKETKPLLSLLDKWLPTNDILFVSINNLLNLPSSISSVKGNHINPKLSPDCSIISFYPVNSEVKLFSSDTLNEIKFLKGHSGRVNNLVFSPSSSYIATTCSDKNIRIWTKESNYNFYELSGHEYKITSIVFSHNSSKLASSDSKGNIFIWDYKNNKISKTFKIGNNKITNLLFSKNGKYIFFIEHDNPPLLKMCSISEEKTVMRRKISSGKSYKIDITNDDRYLFLEISNGTSLDLVEIWDLIKTGHKNILKLPEGKLIKCIFSNKLIVIINDLGEIRIFNFKDRRLKIEDTLYITPLEVSFSSDNILTLVGRSDVSEEFIIERYYFSSKKVENVEKLIKNIQNYNLNKKKNSISLELDELSSISSILPKEVDIEDNQSLSDEELDFLLNNIEKP